MGAIIRWGLLFFVVVWGENILAHPDSIIIYSNVNERLLIGQQISYIEDEDDLFSIDDLIDLDSQNKFEHFKKEVFNRPATRSHFWFKITVSNYSNEDLWLEIGSNYAWYIDFYSPDSMQNYCSPILTGTMRNDSSRLYDTNFFWLPLNKAGDEEVRTYYFKVSSGLTFEMPLSIGSLRSLNKSKDINDYITAGFVGLMLIMFLYNLFIYISIRDKIYLFYLGYILLMAIGQPYANGYPFIQNLNIFFIDKVWWNEYFLFWHPITYFFVGEFCVRYLNLEQNSRPLMIFIRIQIFIIAFIFPILTLFGYEFVDLVNFIQPLILVLYLSCLLAGFYMVSKGRKQAYFYVIGWTFMIGGAFIFFGVINGVIPHNPIWRNILYYGTAIEVWMFSLALGDRLNILKQEKEQIRNDHYKLIAEQNELLERKVKTRTIKLEEQNATLEQINEEISATTEELDKKSKELEELNDSKDRLFAVIGHDLRSPIGSLHNLLELADHNYIDQEEFINVTKKIKKDVGQLHFTLNNLLQWAMVQMQGVTIYQEDFNIYDVIQENILLLDEFAAGKQIEISNNCDPKQLVYADSNHIKIVVLNLLNNSIKFTPINGQITFSLNIENSKCIVELKDTGIGMTTEEAQTLFRLKKNPSTFGTAGEKGTGLGLLLCKDFIDCNHGIIWVESSPGFGTSIFFSLPLSSS